MLDNHNRKQGTDYTVSKLVTSLQGLDSRIQDLPAESEKRKALQASYNKMFKKQEEIDKLLSILGEPMAGQSSEDMKQEYINILERIAEKEAQVQALEGR